VAPAEVDVHGRASPRGGDERRGGPADDPVLGARRRSCDTSTGWRPPPFVGRRTTSSALPSVTARVTITAGWGTDSTWGPVAHASGMPLVIMSSQAAVGEVRRHRPQVGREHAPFWPMPVRAER